MSGLCLVLQRDGEPARGATLEAVLAGLTHRGPDGVDRFLDGPLAAARLRLETTPEDRLERQPVRHRDGRRFLFWDGRIDNRSELAAALGLALGRTRDLSDAELALVAFEAWEEQCWERIVGPFVAAVCCPKAGRVTLVRDPVGDRGLFYHQSPRRLVVASEEAAVLAHPDLEAQVDRRTVARHLGLMEPVDGSTFFQGVTELLPGQSHTVGSGIASSRRWWTAPPAPELRYRRLEEYGEHFRELLDAAVRARLRSTTEPVLQMSGGLDSTSIAVLAADATTRPLPAVSWVFDATACDERRYMEPVYSRSSIEPVHLVSDDALPFEGLERWPHNPNGPEETIFRPMVERMYDTGCRRGSRVMLTGLFGDNLFLGGERWWLDLLRDGRFAEAARSGAGAVRRSGPARFLWHQAVRPMAPWLYPSSHQSAPPVWLTSEARRWIKTDAVWPPSLEAAERPRQHQRVLSLGNAQGTVREQRHLCSFGLELRNPFRDRRLVEFMLAVPAYALEKGGWSKAVLRQAMKGRLPAEVLRRRGKSSFGDLYRRGMTEERRRWLWRRLRRPGALWAGLVDPAWLKRTLWGEVDSRHLLVLSRSVFLDAWARRAGLALSRTIPRTLVGDLS